MSGSNEPSLSTINQWEEAGAAAVSAIGKYLDLCISLGPDSQKDGTPPKALATRIDSALRTLHIELAQQVDESRSILAQTRNHILSSISYFPGGVLSQIFTYVIFDPADPFNPVPMEESLVSIYRSLHNLLGVCSSWRDVALTQSSFWSIVPLAPYSRFSSRRCKPLLSTRLSLERCRNRDLYLAAIVPKPKVDVDLSKHTSQFRSINVMAESNQAIGQVMSHFLKPGSLSRVSDLSICLEWDRPLDQLPPPHHYLFPLDSPEQQSFEGLMKPLSVLRLSGVPVNWNRPVFDRLVELELHKLTLGYDWTLHQFLTCLSSATELRSLKLISVVTFRDYSSKKTTISLPKLQTLLAQDLYFTTLKKLLKTIKSRSHRLTLHLTRKAYEYVVSDEEESGVRDAFPGDLTALVGRVAVNTLLLHGDGDDPWPWMSYDDMAYLLRAMPELETLRTHSWEYYPISCTMIQQSHIDGKSVFPCLKHISFSQVKIWDVPAFKDMVASYADSLESMELSGEVELSGGAEPVYRTLNGEEPIVFWLEENVPNFRFTGNCETLAEFRPLPRWQLW
ncbi:unnamed protein product [Rhizoctonia solani]|uniref:F-box domain-containing protein n=1 Tax=Rhizoctonia solani TaxID=456999 RepID=A0A8H3GFZ5_9AGAM|nr:unnamed protein product [Rhizoctonia solani]